MKLQYNHVRMNHAFILHWIFRSAAAGCFIGHGIFGIITKLEWLPYFALVHIDPKTGYQLSGFPFWEWIERFGSYGATLAGFVLLDWLKMNSSISHRMGFINQFRKS